MKEIIVCWEGHICPIPEEYFSYFEKALTYVHICGRTENTKERARKAMGLFLAQFYKKGGEIESFPHLYQRV